MRRRKKKKFPAKYVLLVMTIFCLAIIFCSFKSVFSISAVNSAVGYVIIPMQKGINQVGSLLSDGRAMLQSKSDLIAENEALRLQLEQANEELSTVQLNQTELAKLKELYEMDQLFSDYDKVAADVIGKDSGNWFSTFIINKGSKDGIEVGMNVLADSGLCGVVIEVGPNYASIRTIIDDSSNVSCQDLTTSEHCVVSGSLKSMNEGGVIHFGNLSDIEDRTSVGDQIVTSNISDLYLEGIPVGYITEVSTDSNKLTKSGKIATITDFAHLDKVFVILQTKQAMNQDEGE